MFPPIIAGHFLHSVTNTQPEQRRTETLNNNNDIGEEIRAQYLAADPNAITKIDRKNSYINELFQDENHSTMGSISVGEIVKHSPDKEHESNSVYSDLLMNDKKVKKHSALLHFDQKLPKTVTNQPSTYCYVNKNGYAQVFQTEYNTEKNHRPEKLQPKSFTMQ